MKEFLSGNKLESRVANSSELNSDSSSLASTFMHSIHADFSSSSENFGMSSFTSSSFAAEDDLTSCSYTYKINFDPSVFENYLSAAASNLESFNSADCEDSLHVYNLEESNVNV